MLLWRLYCYHAFNSWYEPNETLGREVAFTWRLWTREHAGPGFISALLLRWLFWQGKISTPFWRMALGICAFSHKSISEIRHWWGEMMPGVQLLVQIIPKVLSEVEGQGFMQPTWVLPVQTWRTRAYLQVMIQYRFNVLRHPLIPNITALPRPLFWSRNRNLRLC